MGKVTIYLLIMVVILGSILFVQGIFPKSTITPSLEDQESILATQTPGPERDNLQLDTLKFIKCGETVAVDFLVDNSGSMGFGNKMANLKSALLTFGRNFPIKGVIATQIYSSPGYIPPQELIPFSFYGNIKSNFAQIINSMNAYGSTHSKDAFAFTKQKLEVAINDSRFKNQKFNIIFISDGIPETLEQNKLCPGGQGINSEYCTISPLDSSACRCFDPSQDPTQIANDIKSRGVRIFSISYISDEDDKFKEKLRTLMKNVASSPEDFYEAPITNQITAIIKQITTKICKE